MKGLILKDIISKNPVTLSENSSIAVALNLFLENKVEGIPVLGSNSEIIGILTLLKLIKDLQQNINVNLPIKKDFLEKPVIINDDTSVVDVWLSHGNGPFPLVYVDTFNRFSGILTKGDLINAFYKEFLLMQNGISAISRSVFNGVIVIDKNKIIRIFNPQAELVTGVKTSFALGKKADEIFPESDLIEVLQSKKPKLNQKEKIGNSSILSNTFPIIYQRKITGVVQVFQNLNKIESTSRELKELEKLNTIMEMVFENALEEIAVVDEKGIIQYANQKFLTLFNISSQEAIGKHINQVAMGKGIFKAIQSGEKRTVSRFLTESGREFVVQRIPLKKGNKIIGEVGMSLFKDFNDMESILQKLHILEKKVNYYKKKLKSVCPSYYTVNDIIGHSEIIRKTKEIAFKAASNSSNVLILGESGTGKELFAHAIHHASARKMKSFVRVNCSAIPKELLEAELFGYEPNSFTGARKKGRVGKFELSHQGTIFLDEIGDMPLEMQAKLLRVIQEKEIERVGGTNPIRVNFRLITATNQDLEKKVSEGSFRKELYYRINVIRLCLPPLRQRREDIPFLVQYILKRIKEERGISDIFITPEVLDIFERYNWPGNIRELMNIMEYAVNIMEGNSIKLNNLPSFLLNMDRTEEKFDRNYFKRVLHESEKDAILKLIESTQGNVSKAAKIMGVHRTGLYKKLKRYNINHSRFAPSH